jgi:transposase
LVGRAQELLAAAKDLNTLRSAQAVLLPALLNATLEQTAALLGVSWATVPRLQNGLRCRCAEPDMVIPTRGGRRHELMSVEAERDFLAPWAQLASAGNMLVVSPLRAALSQKLGKKISASVVYRLLERHGWRKVAPDTRHPKSDMQAQEDWKKNCPKIWLPSPPQRA